MKHFLVPLFLFISLNFYSQSQQDSFQYRVVYELHFQPDSTDIDSKKTETMWLFLGGKSSLFLSKPLAIKDSLPTMTFADAGSERMDEYMAKTKTDFKYRIMKNRDKMEVYHAIKIMDDKLFYTQPIGTLNWQIQAESKQISGYKAQKATTNFAGRDYITWFTSEIPIPDGPYKFAGLPGLILSIEDTQQQYVFSFGGFEKLSKPMLFQLPLEDHRESSKKDLLNLKERYDEDPIAYINNYMGAGGKVITIGLKGQEKKDYLKKRKSKMAKKNNPIELQ